MNSDAAIITGLRQTERTVAAEYSKAYADFAGSNCSETIRFVLDGHLRISKKLAELENYYAEKPSGEYAGQEEITAFMHSQKLADKMK